MKIKLLLAVLLFVAAVSARATVTLQFNESFVSGVPSNLANASGTVTNGMRWGIVVSTSDSTFSGGGASYDAFTPGAATAGFLSFGGAATDDYYIPGTFTADGSVLLEGDFTTVPGNGSIIDNLIISLAGGVSTNDKFALVWFSDNTTAVGSKYGFFADSSFVLPADGATLGFGSPFIGNDPIRSASNTFAGAAAVPEPSRAFLLLGGVLGLRLRRRRA